MGLLDFLRPKKKQPKYDVTNITLHDLDAGFVFEYDLDTWVVKEKYEYDWGQENFSHEYKIDNGKHIRYLGVEDKGDLFITYLYPLKSSDIGGGVIDSMIRGEKAPSSLVYNGEMYKLAGDSAGYFNNITKKTNEWEELMSWEYLNDSGDKIVNITQWDEKTFDVVGGEVLKEFHISNIIPGEL